MCSLFVSCDVWVLGIRQRKAFKLAFKLKEPFGSSHLTSDPEQNLVHKMRRADLFAVWTPTDTGFFGSEVTLKLLHKHPPTNRIETQYLVFTRAPVELILDDKARGLDRRNVWIFM